MNDAKVQVLDRQLEQGYPRVWLRYGNYISHERTIRAADH
jgi:hypothetical protein